MKGIVFSFALGLGVGIWAQWYFQQEQNKTKLMAAETSVVASAERVTGAIQEKVKQIATEDIKRELDRSGMVVREKARQAGTALSDATANARITALVKARLFTEPGVSAININVDASDGLVTLSGTAASHEEIAKAIRLAMETEGVQKVISTLQLKPK
jgi:hyperosmotically inducible periplasmic protein